MSRTADKKQRRKGEKMKRHTQQPMENNQRPFYLRAMLGMESIVSEVNGSYARPEKPCNASRVRRTGP